MNNNKVFGEIVGVIGGGAWGISIANLIVNSYIFKDYDNRIFYAKDCDISKIECNKSLEKHNNSDNISKKPEKLGQAERFQSSLKSLLIHTHNIQTANEINSHSSHPLYPNLKLSSQIKATTSYADFAESNILVFAVKTQALRTAVEQIIQSTKKKSFDSKNIILASKGLEIDTLMLTTEILQDILSKYNIKPRSISVISGPNFASEVIQHRFSCATLACQDSSMTNELKYYFASNSFYVETTQDIIGVQICGAVKNVLAIAVGIVDGLQMGNNTKAAVITNGINEMHKLIMLYGGDQSTILTYAGIGDLVLTCTNDTSRNMKFGIRIGARILAQFEDKIFHNHEVHILDKLDDCVVEGYYTIEPLYNLSKKLNIIMPIVKFVYQVLFDKQEIDYNLMINMLKRAISG